MAAGQEGKHANLADKASFIFTYLSAWILPRCRVVEPAATGTVYKFNKAATVNPRGRALGAFACPHF
eukprot:925147-Amorphochlora_amoeboformis.AAC.3